MCTCVAGSVFNRLFTCVVGCAPVMRVRAARGCYGPSCRSRLSGAASSLIKLNSDRGIESESKRSSIARACACCSNVVDGSSSEAIDPRLRPDGSLVTLSGHRPAAGRSNKKRDNFRLPPRNP